MTEDTRNITRGDLVGQRRWDIYHEIDLVEGADGHGKVKEDEEEIDHDRHQFEQPQDPVLPNQFLEAGGDFRHLLRAGGDAHDPQADEDGGGGQKTRGHHQVAQCLDRQNVPLVRHDGLHPMALQVVDDPDGGGQGAAPHPVDQPHVIAEQDEEGGAGEQQLQVDMHQGRLHLRAPPEDGRAHQS